ncbi:MAG TPA: nucleotide exchange factor GrpE [Roseiarcus sp.]|nr:nucleotide exchange factor GrpE [Roseiarcus sp.]
MNDAQSANPEGMAPENIDDKPEAAPDPHMVIEKLVAENAELKDRVLRALADTENMRRRSEREAADARAYAVTAFARDLLSVVDNLERALGSLGAESRATGGEALRALAEGVELTANDLTGVLARHGVKRLEPKGEKFDPNFHQAMFEAPSETVPSGAVFEVVQSGWKIGGRVLRPALVGVSKGAPKTAP